MRIASDAIGIHPQWEVPAFIVLGEEGGENEGEPINIIKGASKKVKKIIQQKMGAEIEEQTRAREAAEAARRAEAAEAARRAEAADRKRLRREAAAARRLEWKNVKI